MNTKAHLRRAGRLGLARIQKYGNPGTPEGRRRGGLHSLKNRKPGGKFKTLRQVTFPSQSEALAEFVGICMGDGHVGEYQVSVTTNSETDADHAQYVRRLAQKLFNLPVSLNTRSDVCASTVVISSKEICRFMREQGMTRNKVRDGLTIPSWISENDGYVRMFLRGLFDTDGCVFLDMHHINGRIYKNAGIAFTSRTVALLKFFKGQLEGFGFHPTQKTKYTVFLRREAEIRRYFSLIGTSNPKHERRISEFLRIQGGVA